MNPLKTYDYLMLARGRVFDWARPLTDEQHRRVFAIGLGSLSRTLTHIMTSEWFYIERMLQHHIPPYEQWPIRDENPPDFGVIEAEWTRQAERTRAALAGVQDWDREFEYRVLGDEAPAIVTVCAADVFTQLVLHEVHHRAQAMNMLRQLGVAAEDIDYNALMYKRRSCVAGRGRYSSDKLQE